MRLALACVVLGGTVFALGMSAQPATQPASPFKSAVDLVNVGVTVTDKRGAFVSGLTLEDFAIFEDGKHQSPSFFASGTGDAPEMHLGLLLDVSGSMEEDIAFTRTAAVKFLNTLTEALDVTVVDFDTEVRVARYEQREFARLVERIRSRRTKGQTALFDAIGVYLDGAAGQAGRKIMLVYTDGGDTRSSMRLDELMELIKASDATIYAIGVLDRQSAATRMEQQQVLRQISEASGGQAFFPPSVRELDRVYAQVTAEIRSQYLLGYLSANQKADGNWRKVEIRLTRPDARDLRVRSRRGYYAPLRRD